MLYRVIMDGNDILNFQEKPYILIRPSLEMELNTAGSFDFSMPPCHTFYDDIRPLTSTIEVYEDEDLLWFGRPVEIKTDYFKNKQVYCEGALSFFNDTVQRPHEYDSIYVHDFFNTIVTAHNAQVAPSRQFTVGNVTVQNKIVYRTLRYESTFDVLKRQCLNAEGGYIFIRRENGVNYIDWLAEVPYTTNQPVEFGLNLLDLTSGFNGSSIVTCVLPLGEADQETGKELTIASINDGSDIIESEAVSTYGRITKAVQFNGVRYPDTLYEDGQEYLVSHQFDDLVIECDAAELHMQNPNYEKFRVGQMVHCHSVPHLLDRSFPLLKMSISLDSAAKKITLGSQKSQTLTEITKEDTESALQSIQDIEDLTSEISWNLDHEVIPQIDALYGIPDMDYFSDELSTLTADWGESGILSESIQALLEDFYSAGRPDDAQDILTDLMAEIMDKMSEEAEGGLPDDLNDLIEKFKASDRYGDAEDTLNDLLAKLKEYQTGSDYEDILSKLGKIGSDLDKASNPSSVYDLNKGLSGLSGSVGDVGGQVSGLSSSLADLSTGMEGLSSSYQDLSTQLNDISTQVNGLTQQISSGGISTGGQSGGNGSGSTGEQSGGNGSGWIFQVNGTTAQTGTVNFVTA